MTTFTDAVLRDLDALNALAHETLDEPDDLPPVGSWIGAMRADNKALVARAHLFTGWNARSGNLGVRCSRYRPGWVISAAYEGREGYVFTVDPAPPDDACERCRRLSGTATA